MSDETCAICGAPATRFHALPPWPGQTYQHTSYGCEEHDPAPQQQDDDWRPLYGDDGKQWGWVGPTRSTCSSCRGEYGACGCPKEAVARQWLGHLRDGVHGSVGGTE